MADPVIDYDDQPCCGSPGTSEQTITATLDGGRVYLAILAWETNNQASPTLTIDDADGNIVDGLTLIGRLDDKVGGYEPGAEVHRFQTVESPTGTTSIGVDPTTSIYGWNLVLVDVGDAGVVDEDSIVVQSKIYANLSNHNTNDTFEMDAATTDGNVVLVIQVVESDNAFGNTTTPSGWTELYDNNDGPNPQVSIHWRDDLADATVPSPACSDGYGNKQALAIELDTTGAPAVVAEPYWGVLAG